MKYNIYLNNESESIIYNVLQYLICTGKTEMLRILLDYPTINVNAIILTKTYLLYFWPSKHKTKR